MLPLTIIFTRKYELLGPAIANLISITIFNAIRLVFLWVNFKLFPFTRQSLYTVLLAGASFLICYFSFRNMHGFGGIVLRSLAFMIIYGGTIIYFRLTPDIEPVVQSIKKRLRL
jgi:hypothetical protein